MQRTFWRLEKPDREVKLDYEGDEERKQVEHEVDADAVASLLPNGKHAPALDIDMPCTLRASKTPGHHHLLIDKEMTWRQYKRLMRALVRAGIVEKGYYHASRKKGASFLFLPTPRERWHELFESESDTLQGSGGSSVGRAPASS